MWQQTETKWVTLKLRRERWEVKRKIRGWGFVLKASIWEWLLVFFSFPSNFCRGNLNLPPKKEKRVGINRKKMKGITALRDTNMSKSFISKL